MTITAPDRDHVREPKHDRRERYARELRMLVDADPTLAMSPVRRDGAVIVSVGIRSATFWLSTGTACRRRGWKDEFVHGLNPTQFVAWLKGAK